MLINEAYLEQRFGVKARKNTFRGQCDVNAATTGFASSLENEAESSAFKKIERLVSVRDRSVFETKKRLAKEDFSETAILHAVDKALRCNYLNDQRFADSLVRSRLSQDKGIEGIKRELDEHEISPTVYQPILDSYIELYPSEISRALHLLERKPPRAKNKQQAAFSKLVRSGYSTAIASAAAREWIDIA